MSPSSKTPPAVVEESPEGSGRPDLTSRALHQRIRQQVLAELGVLALQGAPFTELLNETARLTAEGLGSEFCKVMEYLPGDNELLVRAGVGWDAGVIGLARIGADLASPAGFALRTGKPVISNHLENEERFRTPELLVRHGIKRAMNVILQGDGAPFGVLEVDAQTEGDFSEHDITFLQGAANVLGMAIERERHERRLKSALERQQILFKEINHRVKNSLQIVASMFNLQAGDGAEPAVRRQLQEASGRVLAIARAHERLYRNDDIAVVDLGQYLRDVCGDLKLSGHQCVVEVAVGENIRVSTDRAIPLALIATELVTNAFKYAYVSEAKGNVRVSLTQQADNGIVLRVSDTGVGLPPDFDPQRSKGLGMRIVRALAHQVDAQVFVAERGKGAEFVITMPLDAPNGSA